MAKLDGAEGPMAEFVALREEVLQYIQQQQYLVLFQLTVSGAIIGFALSDSGQFGLLLAVPISSYIVFARYLAARNSCRRVSLYIRDRLSTAVPGGLHFDRWLLDNYRWSPLDGGAGANTVTFPGIAAAALVWTYPFTFAGDGSAPARFARVATWVVGVAAVLLMMALVVRDRGGLWRRKPSTAI